MSGFLLLRPVQRDDAHAPLLLPLEVLRLEVEGGHGVLASASAARRRADDVLFSSPSSSASCFFCFALSVANSSITHCSCSRGHAPELAFALRP